MTAFLPPASIIPVPNKAPNLHRISSCFFEVISVRDFLNVSTFGSILSVTYYKTIDRPKKAPYLTKSVESLSIGSNKVMASD